MIILEGVTKIFDTPSGKVTQLVAVDHLHLSIPAGEIFGLVGPNGAGKTTVLRMMCGLLIPTVGRVKVGDVDVQQHPEEAQSHIGYLSDFFSLYEDLKVWEYLDYFARAYRMPAADVPGRVDEVIRRMALQAKRDSLIAGLSRGMKQRVGFGRAIIHNPPVLLLDEPTAGLDPKARAELKELLLELHREGKTVLITSHILADLEEMCTSLGIMQGGKLRQVGTLDQIMREIAGARRFRVRLAAPGFALAQWLSSRPGISDVAGELSPLQAEFMLSGQDPELAALVGELVRAGAPVCGVEEIRETLERLYSRMATPEEG